MAALSSKTGLRRKQALDQIFLSSAAAVIGQLIAFLAGMHGSEWVAFVSMLAACTAAWYARRSSQFSRRKYLLAVAEQRRNEPAIELYLADSEVRRLPYNQRLVYVFRLLVTNKSLAANSIKELSLSLECCYEDQPPRNIVCLHDANIASEIDLNSAEIFRVPCPLAGGEAISGVAAFPASGALLDDSGTASYTVTVTDAHGNKAHKQTFILKEAVS